MKTMTRVILMSALCASTSVFAADWVRVQITGNDQYFYDNSKLTWNGDEITYWKKVQFKMPQQHKGSEIASGVLRERINCMEHSAKLMSYLYYSPSGETLEYVAQDDSAPVPIIPDTIGDAFDHVLCPILWRKQEEARIKNEQKATESELKEASKPKEEEKNVPAKNSVPTRALPTPSVPAVNPPKAVVAKPKPLNGKLPVEKTPPLIPEPQILEQLY